MISGQMISGDTSKFPLARSRCLDGKWGHLDFSTRALGKWKCPALSLSFGFGMDEISRCVLVFQIAKAAAESKLGSVGGGVNKILPSFTKPSALPVWGPFIFRSGIRPKCLPSFVQRSIVDPKLLSVAINCPFADQAIAVIDLSVLIENMCSSRYRDGIRS